MCLSLKIRLDYKTTDVPLARLNRFCLWMQPSRRLMQPWSEGQTRWCRKKRKRNTRSKATWRGKALFGLCYASSHCSSSKEVRAGTWRRGRMQRPWRRAAYWLAPPGLLSLLFFSTPQNLRARMTSLTVGWALSRQSLIKKTPYRPAYSPT